ncbi:uncharacterized protein EI97DRAFT_377434 [Westerdykella ornata]|uniref:Uncharacterized protein n=1 Tax=Westerdykella ornata TaxID=318751 RepID=A0A6A6JLC5_WESOR|nr:uncharacterized protein EI97DRAFT_377434 [Westerdykella ornata]KAF2276456.1 hypothetical protein EI97DRAFT_377434 [Westerdykella ornata]
MFAIDGNPENRPSASLPKETKYKSFLRLFELRQNRTNISRSRTWKPNALRPSVLIFTTLICWSLIAILQVLLVKSRRDGGIQFAPSINDLPLSRTFMHQYLPTILAVLLSILWSWIDLETKRLEPYYQMSRKDGALGKDSLLLHYPFDFIPLVPVSAFKNRHWSVFCASFAVVLVTWGLVPVQAGIFAATQVIKTYPTPIAVSDSYLPAERQRFELTQAYAQSVYAIVTLNETLPPFMTTAYALTPFKPTDAEERAKGNLTAVTTLYSLDMECHESVPYIEGLDVTYTSKDGCNTIGGVKPNEVYGMDVYGEVDLSLQGRRKYTIRYVGYWNDVGIADYSLDQTCDTKYNHTFYAGIIRNKDRASDPENHGASVFCEASYYQQEVNATVDASTKSPQHIVPIGPKMQLAPDVFNTTLFESQLNAGAGIVETRGALPIASLPSYAGRLADRNISLLSAPVPGSLEVHAVAALAVLSGGRPVEDYLDAKVLGESYQTAYRLLFSRAMVEVLNQNFTSVKQVMGEHKMQTQAVILVPAFTYIVVGLLGALSIASLGLLYFSVGRSVCLRSDPSTIASVMALTADEEPILTQFERLDTRPMKAIQDAVSNRRYMLVDNDVRAGTHDSSSALTTHLSIIESDRDTHIEEPPTSDMEEVAKPVRPVEFRSFVAVPFVTLHLGLAVTLTVLFIKGRINGNFSITGAWRYLTELIIYTLGFPLPSTNKIVQNIVQKYIPTATATLIEPMWILINRLLCLLQQLEELRSGHAVAKRSIDLDYASLPPQLVIFKALRSRHFLLASVCSMALLANVLSVAFADLFRQNPVNITTASQFQIPFESKFVYVNGTMGPPYRSRLARGESIGEASGAWSGGKGDDQFLIARSNITGGTPLPPWTDEKMVYMPFITGNDSISLYSARTTAFGSTLECKPLVAGVNWTATLYPSPQDPNDLLMNFSTIVTTASGDQVRCADQHTIRRGLVDYQNRQAGYLCQEGPIAAEFTSFLFAERDNATKAEEDACAGALAFGWTRNATGTCGPLVERTLNDGDTLFIQCTPKVLVGEATVLVDAQGRLQRPASDIKVLEGMSPKELATYFSNDPLELIKQSKKFLFDAGAMWHNDKFASHFINYFIRARNGSRVLDPQLPPPTFTDVEEPMESVYSYLFSIWLGSNKEKLFVPYDKAAAPSLSGSTITTRERLFLSTTMSAIALGILCLYALVSVLVYLRRPGQYLARLPTCIASIIALFAASEAVRDFQGTSRYGKKERARYLEGLGLHYGYGGFIGRDGRVHVGIEKSSHLATRRTTTWWEKALNNYRKR